MTHASPEPLPFVKMNGLGNDFVIIDARRREVGIGAGGARGVADRTSGIGCDQLIVIEAPPPGADVRMRIFNADGSEVAACGNATRCVGSLVMAETGRSDIVIATAAGRLAVRAGTAGAVTVDMGPPRLGWREIPLAHAVDDIRTVRVEPRHGVPDLGPATCVSMGNPHAIFWVDDPHAFDLAAFGPALEHHPLFPERANISLVGVRGGNHLVQRVWERGAGLTLACGTGACAAAVAAALTGRTDLDVTVSLPGGDLGIVWGADDRVLMTGPVATEFTGVLDPALLAGA